MERSSKFLSGWLSDDRGCVYLLPFDLTTNNGTRIPKNAFCILLFQQKDIIDVDRKTMQNRRTMFFMQISHIFQQSDDPPQSAPFFDQ